MPGDCPRSGSTAVKSWHILMSDPRSRELFDRAANLHRHAATLLADHQRIHIEMVEIFRKIKRLHYVAPVLGPAPPEPPPARFN